MEGDGVIDGFEAVDQRTALEGDAAGGGAYGWMGVDSLDGHGQVENQTVSSTPPAVDVCVAVAQLQRNFLARDRQTGLFAPAWNAQIETKLARLGHFNCKMYRPIPGIVGLLVECYLPGLQLDSGRALYVEMDDNLILAHSIHVLSQREKQARNIGWAARAFIPGLTMVGTIALQGVDIKKGRSIERDTTEYTSTLKRFGNQAAGMETVGVSHLAMTLAADLVDQLKG